MIEEESCKKVWVQVIGRMIGQEGYKKVLVTGKMIGQVGYKKVLVIGQVGCKKVGVLVIGKLIGQVGCKKVERQDCKKVEGKYTY